MTPDHVTQPNVNSFLVIISATEVRTIVGKSLRYKERVWELFLGKLVFHSINTMFITFDIAKTILSLIRLDLVYISWWRNLGCWNYMEVLLLIKWLILLWRLSRTCIYDHWLGVIDILMCAIELNEQWYFLICHI